MIHIVVCSAGGWDEKFLQQESELRRVRSEKANLEQHILGMESELETLQEESTKVKTEMENQRKTSLCMEQQIETLTTEVSGPACCVNTICIHVCGFTGPKLGLFIIK